MKIAKNWKDYEILATSCGEKLERWGSVMLLRPDPQVIWNTGKDLSKTAQLNAHYLRESTGGGMWKKLRPMPDWWQISYKNLKFKICPMGFKHTGLFPEQSVNWDKMEQLAPPLSARRRRLP